MAAGAWGAILAVSWSCDINGRFRRNFTVVYALLLSCTWLGSIMLCKSAVSFVTVGLNHLSLRWVYLVPPHVRCPICAGLPGRSNSIVNYA